MERLKKQLDFIIEIDKIKNIYRHTSLFDGNRKENDAEHSWHISLMALIFSEYANEANINMLKVLKMLLIHDLVEIHAGDYIVYTEKVEEKAAKELEGAKKVFGLLPDDQEKEFMDLWLEFEKRESKESKFASVFDRFEPILQNYINGGGTWTEFDIKSSQIIDKNSIIKDGSETIWNYVENILNEFLEKNIIQK